MSEAAEVDSFYNLFEEIKEVGAKLIDLHSRTTLRSRENVVWESTYQFSLIQEALKIRRRASLLCDDLLNNGLSDPSLAVNHIWNIIELYSHSPEAVIEGTQVLERVFKSKMRSMIKPVNYLNTIVAYVQWQNDTVRCFVEQFEKRPRSNELKKIEQLWNFNRRENEKMFLGGVARPLHLKRVTDFSGLIGVDYDTLRPLFKENRNALVEALTTLLHQESQVYWPNYEIFPCHSSSTIIDKCLQYFYFKDRQNTWFINSSASDYIPFVSSARELFAEKFNGSDMSSPGQHNTEWILTNLKQRCSRIHNQQNNEMKPVIIVLLTSKNRFGHRIDVDLIHSELTRLFSNIFTIVDGCQDGRAFAEVDIAIYTKRFTTTGALGLVNKAFLSKHSLLRKKLTVAASFPVGILAQIFINVNMANTGLAHGVEDLVNSSWWPFWRCPIEYDLYSTFGDSNISGSTVEYSRYPIRYSFTKDYIGTILVVTADHDGQILLPKLWALMKKQGHSLDCFVMDNPYLKSINAVYSEKIRELIVGKFVEELRQIEMLSSDYLVWPLVPFWVASPDDISIGQLLEHFETSYTYHCCLRISVGRCGYPGKLKRFVDHIDSIIRRNELDVSDDFLGKHSSQWPS